MNVEHRKPFTCYLLIVLHFFLGIGALIGGGSLILSPDGSILHITPKMLQYTLFNNYLIPGLLLFFVLGVFPIFVAIFLITEKPLKFAENLSIYKTVYWSWNYSMYIGFILIVWITVEMYMIQVISFLHVFYIFLGLLIQANTLFPSVKEHYSHI